MHGASLGQCDWSGIMFKLPGVSFKFKTGASGLYCNWESAMAHVTHVLSSDSELKSYTTRAITKKVGVLPNEAPHFEHLKWFGGYMDESNYTDACEIEAGELDGVLSIDGVEESVTLDSVNGEFFAFPEWRSLEPAMHSTPDWQIVALTESHSKRKIWVKESLLEPWRGRPRYLDLTLAEWKQITKSKEEKKYQRCKLQDQLIAYEALASKDAVLPKSLMKGMKLPGKSGKALVGYAVLHSLPR
jgi:hypothetical protein